MGANEHPSLRCRAASSQAQTLCEVLAVMGTALDAPPKNELCTPMLGMLQVGLVVWG